MKVTEVNNLSKYLIGAKLIGIGTTAICFLMQNGQVIKIYLDTYHKRDLFNRREMFSHLEYLNSLNSEYYIAPIEMLVKDGKVIAYIMDFVPGKTLKRLSKKTKLTEVIGALKRLEEATYKVTEAKFRLGDLHDRNIIYNGELVVIDLDNGYLTDNYKENNLMNYNMQDLINQVIYSIFGIKFNQDIYFKNPDLDSEYKQIVYREYKEYINFLYSLAKEIGEVSPTIGELQKKKNLLLTTTRHYDYYGRDFY